MRFTASCMAAALATLTLSGCGGERPPSGAPRDPAPPAPAAAEAAAPADTARSEERASSYAFGVFGFTDMAGRRLLGLGSNTEPMPLRWAVCDEARRAGIAFERTQRADTAGSGRQIAANFELEPGHVYRSDAALGADVVCLLTADSVLAASATGPLKAASDTCEPDALRGIVAERQRDARACAVLATLDDTTSVLAVEFVIRDSSALASVVLARPGGRSFLDFSAVYRGPDEDVWRVSDGGRFSPQNMRLLFHSRCGAFECIVLAWAGEEGENAYLAVADQPGRLSVPLRSYRYWVPE